MWTPWAWTAEWGRARHEAAVNNAREAATECSRARLERVEVALYLAELAERRTRPAVTA